MANFHKFSAFFAYQLTKFFVNLNSSSKRCKRSNNELMPTPLSNCIPIKTTSFPCNYTSFGSNPTSKPRFLGGNLPPPVINAAMRVPSVKRAEVVPQTPKRMDVRSMGRVELMWYMFTTSISVQIYNYNIYILSKMQLQMQWPCLLIFVGGGVCSN